MIRYALARFRRGFDTAFGLCRFNAGITPMRAIIVGPSCSATSMSACIAACHSGASCSALGSLVMIAQRDELASVWQDDWIEELLVPRHENCPEQTTDIDLYQRMVTKHHILWRVKIP